MRIRLKAKDAEGNPIPPQHFTGVETFQPDEVRDVPDDQAEILLRSPFIEKAEPTKSEQRRHKSMRGVESDE